MTADVRFYATTFTWLLQFGLSFDVMKPSLQSKLLSLSIQFQLPDFLRFHLISSAHFLHFTLFSRTCIKSMPELLVCVSSVIGSFHEVSIDRRFLLGA